MVDRYIPNDDEYRIVICDNVNIFTPERGFNLRDTITMFSSNHCVRLRNIYGFTMVNIQQQAADKEGNETFKLDRLTPSPDGLGDCKTTARDCNVMLGLFSPYRFKKSTWEGYNVGLFQDNIRFLEVCVDRNGSSGAVCPLYFDGAVNFFAELPAPSNHTGLTPYLELAKKAQGLC